jgi:gliding motility-associated-like protein
MTKLALAAILFTTSFCYTTAQTTLYFQNGNAGDNWSFSSTGADATALAESLSPLNYTSAPQSLVVGGNTPGGSCIDGGTGNGPTTSRTYTFDDVDISSSNQYTRTLTFNWGNRHPVCTGTGWDTGENLIFTPIHDGIAQPNITLAVGANDAIFNINSNSTTYTIPPCVNSFSFILSINTNRRDELLFLDDVLLTTPAFNVTQQPTQISFTVCPNELPFNWNGIQINEAGVYEANLSTASGCDSLVQLTLNIAEAAILNLSFTVCEGNYPTVINGLNINGPGTYTQAFTNADGCDSLVILDVSTSLTYNFYDLINICETELPYLFNGQSYAASGNYVIPFTTQFGCDSIYVLDLFVSQSPVSDISFSNTTVFTTDPTVIVTNNSSNFTNWSWVVLGVPPLFTIDSILSPTITLPNIPGTYSIQWLMSSGVCVTTETFLFTVIEPEFIWNFSLPNVFTPNNDGANDALQFDFTDLEFIEIVIVNRWGQTVFYTRSADEFWNGTVMNIGEASPEGVYFYQITVRAPNNEERTFQQYVHLVRK